ncbi:LacI family transcriptional regulator [Azospirillum lipoferum]|uniref:LacI family transcriptional regulator n=1 Tax=Azospirillum lipoferum TaxID=193 RepID=A0A5A9FY02_AZOLI|nr:MULTISPECIES: LacI family DNA-binding transcriptional regulator [Azospirillum]KAA0585919.1 LacI family transcriptional regulator [Azospirillum lipoferum]MCP1615132.1 LacI family transcriptional regulator [Azospirillum lipoferum]MDW5533029.1 LacI family DNA-binding transcriptional regulator [Azospirillum sp. NL1]
MNNQASDAPLTLRDVAAAAGVSLATADRVVNGRPGVSAKTARKVHEAVQRLGFRPLAAAAELARARSWRFAVILPGGGNRFMMDIADNIRAQADWFRARRIGVEIVEADVFDADTLAAELATLPGRFDGVALVALDHPRIRAAIDDLVEGGMAVVTLVSDAPSSRRQHYVGIDNIAAGRTAGSLVGRFLGPPRAGEPGGAVGIITGSGSLRDHAERRFGFGQVLAEEYPHLTRLNPVEGRDDPERNRDLVRRMLADTPDLVAIYNTGEGSVGIGEALAEAGLTRKILCVGHELTPATRRMLLDGTFAALVAQDPGHEVRSMARVLHALVAGQEIVAAQEHIRVQVILRDNLP